MFLYRIALTATLIIFSLNIQAQQRCGTNWLDFKDLLQNPAYRVLNTTGKELSTATADTLLIPVVVHVIYNTGEENISDEQIQSQIDVLNEDYAGTNGTSAEVPDAWKGLVTDSKIRFCLARRTPGGQNTTGITRKYTSVSEFIVFDSSIKYDASGGTDAWPTDQYLNIWVCNLANNVLGFATFPGSDPAEDGVVIHYRAFGRVGDLSTKYNYGRSATHEVGHWFQLVHIWGDSPDCLIDDMVDDTPIQADANYCCPKYPKYDGCTGGGDGIMFMNYMDYSDDKFMQFFTPDQITRMDTAINQYRSALFVSPGVDEVSMRNVDLSVEEVTNPVREAVVRCFTPVVKLKNRGATTIRGFELVYGIYEGNQQHVSFTDSLISGAEISVILPEMAGKNGQNILQVRISAADSNTVNNYITRSFYSEDDNALGCDDDDPLVYPNPVMGTSFCVKSNFTKTQKMTIRLVNTLGQAVYETEVTSNPGDIFSVPSAGLSRGVYFLQMDGEDESRAKSLIIFPDGSSGDSTCP